MTICLSQPLMLQNTSKEQSYVMWWSGTSAMFCGSDSSLMNNQEIKNRAQKVCGAPPASSETVGYLTAPFTWSYPNKTKPPSDNCFKRFLPQFWYYPQISPIREHDYNDPLPNPRVSCSGGKREPSPAVTSSACFSHEVMSAYIEPYGVCICALFLLESLFVSSATVFSINILNSYVSINMLILISPLIQN